MWIEIDGLEELEHEGVKCYVVLVNVNTGVQVVKRIREHATDEKGDIKNRYQLLLRDLNGKGQSLKTGDEGEIDGEIKKLKEVIKEKQGNLFKL